MKFCTYLTIYTGNKMPMFYIGRSTIEKVVNGYHGQVQSKKFKDTWVKEIKTNPHLFKTIILQKHSTKKEQADREEFIHKHFSVHKNNMYINQATGYGSFFAELSGSNNPMYNQKRFGELNPMHGKKHSMEQREKMSKSQKGKHSQPKTEKFKKQTSDRQKGKSFEERFGVEKAKLIKEKQSKPKSQEHKQIMGENAARRICCLYCKRDFVRLNFNRFHGEKCKLFTALTLENFL